MRHRIKGKQLNRTSAHRTAMFRNLAAGLFEHGQIETTMPKAKAVQPMVEKMITIAKRGDFTARRQLESMVNDRKIFAWVADPNVPDERKDNPFFDLPDEDEIEFNRYGSLRKAPRLVQHLMSTVAPLFEDRDGGYTRIIKTGRHRLGDAAEIVILQLVGFESGPELGGGASQRRRKADKRNAFAKKVLKAGTGEEAATAVVETEEEAAGEPPVREDVTSEAEVSEERNLETGETTTEGGEETKKED